VSLGPVIVKALCVAFAIAGDRLQAEDMVTDDSRDSWPLLGGRHYDESLNISRELVTATPRRLCTAGSRSERLADVDPDQTQRQGLFLSHP